MFSRIGVVFFALAVWMLYWQLHKYSIEDVLHSVTQIPLPSIIWSMTACLAEYLVLSCYDFLALCYIGKRLAWWKWMLAGSLGFAVSNNAGNAAISGGAIRYRLYTRWRVRAGEIVKMLTFSGFTYFLGAATATLIGYFMLSGSGGASIPVMRFLFGVCCALLGVYFFASLFFQGKTFRIGDIVFRVPSPRMAVEQCLLGTTDSVLAGLVLYFLTMHAIDISVVEFVAIFVIAQAAGIFAQVPGGIGVFESVFLLGMPDSADKAVLFGCLLAFRIIFFLLPLFGVGMTFFIYEHYLRNKMKKWRMFSLPKLHLPHLKHKKDK
ncbi:MAG: hypothetical protein LBD94_00390 [Rickettsiales bacterium]|jgi:uncharacterized membrane protein YbhN (UPF0104 family)|nr:hypothetical protein [Rickettsiales bacterium]